MSAEPDAVVDAWEEPGAEHVESLLGRCVVSAVNWAEVLQRCLALARRLGIAAHTADRDWRKVELGVEVVLIR